MDEILSLDKVIETMIANLGVSGVFIALFFKAWKKIEEKDKKIYEMTDKLLVAYNENTKATTEHSSVLKDLSKQIKRNHGKSRDN